MRSLAIALPLCALFSIPGVLAKKGGDDCCLSPEAAKKLVDAYASILMLPSDSPKFNQTLDEIASASFSEVSDSINILAGLPLGSVTFPNRTAFEASKVRQPVLAIETLQISVACETITWRWRQTPTPAGPGGPASPTTVQGIHIFDTKDRLLQTAFYEFNSVAWALDAGYNVAPPIGKPQKR